MLSDCDGGRLTPTHQRGRPGLQLACRLPGQVLFLIDDDVIRFQMHNLIRLYTILARITADHCI
jgi:hypothetical protein